MKNYDLSIHICQLFLKDMYNLRAYSQKGVSLIIEMHLSVLKPLNYIIDLYISGDSILQFTFRLRYKSRP